MTSIKIASKPVATTQQPAPMSISSLEKVAERAVTEKIASYFGWKDAKIMWIGDCTDDWALVAKQTIVNLKGIADEHLAKIDVLGSRRGGDFEIGIAFDRRNGQILTVYNNGRFEGSLFQPSKR